jgi:DUF4097 and DUF4098 domain-containing protein YvlB
MNRTAKHWILAACILLVLGAGVAFAGFAAGGFRLSSFNTVEPYEKKTASFRGDQITGLLLKGMSDDVEIAVTDGEEVTVTYYESTRETYEVTLEDGRLAIQYHSNRKWYDFIQIDLSFQERKLTVTLPRSLAASVEVTTVSGDVAASGFTVGGNCSIDTTSGGIFLADLDVNGDMSLHTVSGTSQLNNVRTRGKMRAESTSGDTQFERLTAGGGISLYSISGSTTVEGAQVTGDFAVNTTSGDLKIADVRVDGNVQLGGVSAKISLDRVQGVDFSLKSTSGDIWGTLAGDEREYTIESQTTSGDVNLPHSKDGPRMLSVATVSGNIDLDFVEP